MAGRFHHLWVAHMANRASRQHKPPSSKVGYCLMLYACMQCVCCVLGLQQSQGVHPFMNAAAIPYGNMFYANSAMLPSLYPTLGLPGFSHSVSTVMR